MNMPARVEPASQEIATLPATSSPAEMLRAAAAAGMTPDQVREMLAIQKDWEANEARKAYVAAMAEFKANPPEIVKKKLVSFTNQKGDTTSYRHATLHGVTSAIVAALAQLGFSHRWETQQPDGGLIIVTCVITHRLGHSESTTLRSLPDNSGGKNGIQAVASTVSYLERYTLLAATGLATKDMDDDGNGAEPNAKVLEWLDAIEQCDALPALESLGADLAKSTLGKDDKALIRTSYARRKRELQQ